MGMTADDEIDAPGGVKLGGQLLILKEADVGHEDCAVNIVAAIAVDDAADFRDGIFNIDELCQQRVFLGIGHYFVGDDADEQYLDAVDIDDFVRVK